MILACLCAMCVSFAVSMQDVDQQIQLLNQHFAERTESAAMSAHDLAAWRDSWIHRFEELLVDVERSGGRPASQLLQTLGTLYQQAGKHDAAEIAFAAILRDTSVSAPLRIDAGIQASSAAAMSAVSPSQILDYYDEMQVLASGYVFAGDDSHDRLFSRYIALPRLMGDHLTLMASRFLEHGIDQSRDGRAQLETLMEIDSMAHRSYLEFLALMQDPAMLPLIESAPERPQLGLTTDGVFNALTRIATLGAALSDHMSEAELHGLASEYRRDTTSMLLDAMDTYGVQSFPEQTMSLLLRELLPMMPIGEFVRFAGEVLSQYRPSHNVLIFLQTTAIDASNHRESMIRANQLFDLLIGTAEAWFPEEFKLHPSWQLAIVRDAYVLLQLGDIEGAERRLAQIDPDLLSGDFLVQMFDETTAMVASRRAAGHDPRDTVSRGDRGNGETHLESQVVIGQEGDQSQAGNSPSNVPIAGPAPAADEQRAGSATVLVAVGIGAGIVAMCLVILVLRRRQL